MYVYTRGILVGTLAAAIGKKGIVYVVSPLYPFLSFYFHVRRDGLEPKNSTYMYIHVHIH